MDDPFIVRCKRCKTRKLKYLRCHVCYPYACYVNPLSEPAHAAVAERDGTTRRVAQFERAEGMPLTEVSRYHRSLLIAGHEHQCHACLSTLMWLYAHHDSATVARHEARILRGLESISRRFYEGERDGVLAGVRDESGAGRGPLVAEPGRDVGLGEAVGALDPQAGELATAAMGAG